jgi:hypothetical protein
MVDSEPANVDRLAVCKAAQEGMAVVGLLDGFVRKSADARSVQETIPGFFDYLANLHGELVVAAHSFDLLEAVFAREAPSVALVRGKHYSSYHSGAITFAQVVLHLVWDACGCPEKPDPDKLVANWGKVCESVLPLLGENELTAIVAGLDIEAVRVLPESNKHCWWELTRSIPFEPSAYLGISVYIVTVSRPGFKPVDFTVLEMKLVTEMIRAQENGMHFKKLIPVVARDEDRLRDYLKGAQPKLEKLGLRIDAPGTGIWTLVELVSG